MMTMTTKTKTKSQETQKERKKNWKEVYASVEDIQQFETARSEHELIDEYFRQPVGIEGGEYLPASVILQLVGGTSMKDINATKLGRALTAMGFESKMTRGIRRYRVVRRSTSEMQQHRQLLNVDSESGGVVE
jgi:hypothetical protein